MTDLIGELVSKLGVEEGQAKGGAGLIFKLAQEKLGADFSKVAQALPAVQGLIASAPQAGGVAQKLGGLLGSLGGGPAKGLADLAGLAGGFSQLRMDGSLVAKFIPIVLEFAKSRGGQEIAGLLVRVLKK